MKTTFKGGVHLEEYKELAAGPAIRRMDTPKRVFIPLSQHTGAPCQSVVTKGDAVTVGQMIGRSEKFISSPVHASISGKAANIDKYPHPTLGWCEAVEIESDGTDALHPSIKERQDVRNLSRDQLRAIIRDAGCVGLGGAAFPTHVKLTPPQNKKIDSVILNGAECEPYLTCDHRLMLEKADEIVEGLKIILDIVGARDAYIAVESNKMAARFNIEKSVRKKGLPAKVVILQTKYPQGSEKQLIEVVLQREVPPGGLPMDVGCLVQNVGTAQSIYEAVYKGKPLYERVVTLSGDCIKEPCNLLARIGTPLEELVKAAGGFVEEPAKVVAGGPMMGIAQFSLEIPVIKGSTGFLFFSKEAVRTLPEDTCIRCARCVDVCPLRLVPADIFRLTKFVKYDRLAEYNILDCIECGACSYGCPSNIPLVQWIKLGKAEFSKLKVKK